jgi:hypothetical protein
MNDRFRLLMNGQLSKLKAAFAALTCLALALGIGTIPARLSGQTGKSADSEFQKTIVPFISRNCLACHSGSSASSGLDLTVFQTAASVREKPEVWKLVAEKLKSGQMPPQGIPKPPENESGSVVSWIQTTLGGGAAAVAKSGPQVPAGDPGRVTMRRMNRSEYNNTVRDLLGVDARPADDFPLDDAGYGFDNNGDVLSLSPLLMEKYMAAARSLSHLAVYGPALAKEPGLLIKILGSTGPTQGASEGATLRILPFSLRGVIETTVAFPVDGEYEFHLKPSDYRGLQQGPPLHPGALVSKGAPPPVRGRGPAAPPAGGRGEGAGAAQAGTGGGRGEGAPAAGPGRAPAGGGRGPLTPEQIAAREEKLRQDYPPARWSFLIDGKLIQEGTHAGGYDIDQGAVPQVTVRVPLRAGDHVLHASYPDLANIDDPTDNLLLNKMRALQIPGIDVLGPYNPAPQAAPSRAKIFICATEDEPCARRIATRLATRAYRRPATSVEIEQLMKVFQTARNQKRTFDESIRAVVEAVLLSPNFLFRVESDPKAVAETGTPARFLMGKPAPDQPSVSAVSTKSAHPISDYELASRLSYFLWSSMPDDDLMNAAAAKKLRQPGTIDAEMKRMMADPKSEALVENFGGQWLGLRELRRKGPDPDRFPAVDAQLLRDMERETTLFLQAMFREDRSLLDFIDAPFTYVNGPLAKHYGIPGVEGEEFRRVNLTGEQRSGILTQASVLVVSSYPTRTSVVTRGKWVLENILGTPPPPPPPNVPSLKDSDIGSSTTLRERMEQHRADPMCASCHAQLDPMGFGLENYDASGSWRTMDGKFPIDASGTLPDGRKFNGAKELKQILRGQSDLFARNMVEKMLTYALGRGVEQFDAPTVDQITAKLKANNYRISVLISEIIKSKPFQMRGGEY